MSIQRIFFPLFAAVVAIQGVHVIEHVIQLFQVYVFGVPDEDALGLLGWFFHPNGTEEWLHLGFNSATCWRSSRSFRHCESRSEWASRSGRSPCSPSERWASKRGT